MRESLHVEPEFKKLLPFINQRHPFESVSEFFGFKLGKDQRRRAKVVRKLLDDPDGGTVAVYFKLYGYRRLKRALSRVFKPTRSKSEFANLKFFHELGIPACQPILQGEYRNVFGIARNCMIITEEVTGTTQLDHFIKKLEAGDDPEDVKKAIRRQIIESIAENTRKIHDHRFFHDDLKWRNVLVRRVGERGEKVEVFWIDCPNGYFDKTGGIRGKHGRIKDLATLDHLGWRMCPLEERMYFLSCYSGLALDDPALAELGEEVVEYRKRKLDD
ncbi:lipopolysaccharide kinase InaA family protein [Oceaniferula spumae]|uniref:lipopolysaccharide kinase InaA family protein n=1 Tax=Oceaniferula spumae TaxID=2979115 RepID=UPI003F4EA162